MKEYQRITKNMLEFISKSPSSYHAVANVKKVLEKEGFQELRESQQWNVEWGRGYFVTRNDSSIIAVRLPESKKGINSGKDDRIQAKKNGVIPDNADMGAKGFHIAASHSDSPAFKVKEYPEITVEDKYVKLNTEKYGGMILTTWLDRPLSVAGRIVVRGQEENEVRLVNIDKDLCVIPNVAIHMNRDMNKGMEYNPQVDMLPLFADSMDSQGKGALLKRAAKAAGVKADQILAHDLFLYAREEGKMIGENGEFILSPRLDDLQCVYASMAAFAETVPEEYINVCAVFDNEEVGSGTRQGADSTFLEDVLFRTGEALGITGSNQCRMVAGSFLISADNAHAVHPNHPEKADPTNRPYLNGGIVIKYHGSQKYTTDAISAGKLKLWCEKAGVPYQSYANRSDVAGGSTLGNISASHVSLESVDIGLPQLAMHSAVETAGVRDTEYAVRLFQEFFRE